MPPANAAAASGPRRSAPRLPTGLEGLAGEALALLARSASARWLEFHVFGPEGDHITLGHQGIPAEFHAAYHQTGAWRLDPLAAPRRAGGGLGLLSLEQAPSAGPDRQSYTGFLHSFGLGGAAELIFCDGSQVIGGVSMIWTADTAHDRAHDMAVIANLQPFLDFTVRETWRTTGIGRRTRLMRLYRLTTREQEIAQLMCSGETNPAIARRLGISLATVKTHVLAILRKLQAANRTEALSKIVGVRGDRPGGGPRAGHG